MRIVTANNYYYLRGGSERVLFDEEKILIESGQEVFPFSTFHEESGSASSNTLLIDARGIGTAHGWERIAKLSSVFHNSTVAEAFANMLDVRQPDLVHVHNIYGTLTTAVLVEAKRRGIPAVMTAHDMKLVCPTYLCLDHGRSCEACGGRNFYRAALHACHRNGLAASAIFALESYFNRWLRRYESLHRIIVPSRFLRDLLIRNGIPGNRIAYIPNGVDVQNISPQPEPGEYVLYAGRLSSEKGILTLMRAMRGTAVPLRVVGDGPLRSEVERNIRDADNIYLEGYRRGVQLASLFKDAAFVVLPSEWYENAPLSLLEAYAYGKPVLGAQIGGIPELVVPGETGLLFEAGNEDQLRDLILDLWGRRDRVKGMGKNARGLVEAEYSLSLHGDRLVDLYRECLN